MSISARREQVPFSMAIGNGELMHDPFGNCLPGIELLQSPFKMEFSMGLLSRWYRRSLQRHRRFLQSYRRFLCGVIADFCWVIAIHEAIGGRRPPILIVAQLTKHHKTLLNIVKHHETVVKHCDTSWNVMKHLEPFLKHCETLEQSNSPFDATTSALDGWCGDIGARRGDIGARAEIPAISAIAELE